MGRQRIGGFKRNLKIELLTRDRRADARTLRNQQSFTADAPRDRHRSHTRPRLRRRSRRGNVGHRRSPAENGRRASERRCTCGSVALSPNGQTVAVAAAGANAISVLETESLNERFRVIVPGRPVRVTYAPDLLLVSLSDRGALAVLDLDSGVLQDLIPVGRLPDGVALDDSGKIAYVTAASSDLVAVIDQEQRQVVRTLAVAGEPATVVWTTALP